MQAGLEAANFRHGLGAQFLDVNGDGRPDLYVANDEDPNDLYVNVPWPGGVTSRSRGTRVPLRGPRRRRGYADPFAGMGIASTRAPAGRSASSSRTRAASPRPRSGSAPPGRPRSRTRGPTFDPALGSGFAGWGASWVDLAELGQARSRPDGGRDPGHEPRHRMRSRCACSPRLASALRLTRTASSANGASAAERPGARSRRRRQRRSHGDRRQHDRRQARAAARRAGRAATGSTSALVAVRAGRDRHRRAPERDEADARRCRPAAATSRRRIRASTSGSVQRRRVTPLSCATRRGESTVRLPSVRADRIVTCRAPARRPACRLRRVRTGSRTARRSCTAVRSRRSGTKRPTGELRGGSAPEPVQARDLYDVSAAMCERLSRRR